MKKTTKKDIEKTYSTIEFTKKIRRLADALESDKRFSIQIAGEKIYIPKSASISIEHERGDEDEEIEFQIRWKH